MWGWGQQRAGGGGGGNSANRAGACRFSNGACRVEMSSAPETATQSLPIRQSSASVLGCANTGHGLWFGVHRSCTCLCPLRPLGPAQGTPMPRAHLHPSSQHVLRVPQVLMHPLGAARPAFLRRLQRPHALGYWPAVSDM